MTNLIICVFGKKGYGKTHFVKHTLLPQFDKLIIIDSLAEYEDGVLISDIPSLADYLEKNQDGPYRIIYREPLAHTEDLEPSAAFKIGWSAIGATIVIEELDIHASAISSPASIQCLLRYGRHREINTIGISRRAAEVPRTITSQADLLISFNQQEPRDLAYIGSFAGKEFANALTELDYREYLVWGNKEIANSLGLSVFQGKEKEKKKEKKELDKDSDTE